MRYLLLLAPVLVAAPFALLGCPADDPAAPADAGPDVVVADAIEEPLPATCDAGFLGDPSQPPQIEIRALQADGTDVPLEEGGDVAIVFPPQGGRVLFVGVRALNVDACGIQVTGALRDIATKQIRLDGRTLNLERESDGWGTSGTGTTVDFEDSALIGNYSNVPVCPNEWASVDIFDQSFELELLVQDRQNRQVSKTIHVTPRCSEPGAKETACRCLCKHGYVLGETCGEDAGTDGGML